MREGPVEIELEDGWIEAFVACPDEAGRRPPVILLADDGADLAALAAAARRLAGEGFFVLAPAAPDEPVEEAFDAWLDYLAGERLTDDTRVGVLGYGAGAGLALRLAAVHGERIAAVAAFDPAPLAQEDLHHIAGCLNAVVHLGFSDRSPAVEPGGAGLEAELRRAGVDFELQAYAAEAGFQPPGGPGTDAAAEDLHWQGLTELFRRTLAVAEVDTADRTATISSSGY